MCNIRIPENKYQYFDSDIFFPILQLPNTALGKQLQHFLFFFIILFLIGEAAKLILKASSVEAESLSTKLHPGVIFSAVI